MIALQEDLHDTEKRPPFENPVDRSSLNVSIIEGSKLNLWSIAKVTERKAEREFQVDLRPGQAVVIGRQEGGKIEYLDPRFRSTQMLPNSNRRVVTSLGRGKDRSVSRAHFMLKGSRHGILLINGVPQNGGGIRPPLNGTHMLEPVNRWLDDSEKILIEHGRTVKIRLPNDTVILLRAE
jgi:hypothetical protein